MTTENALVQHETREVVPWNETQIDALRKTVAPDLTDPEFVVFAEVCRVSGLNPFARQVHAVKRKGKLTIQTGIDGYRLIAARTGAHMGTTDAKYDREDAQHPGTATVTVYRRVNGENVAFPATARWDEYVIEGDQGFMWRKMPYLMLAKVAESLALRKAFPAELSGVYADDELPPEPRPGSVEVTVENVHEGNITKPKHDTSWTPKERRRFMARLKELDAPPYDEVAAWLESDGRRRPSEMPQAERDAFLEALERKRAAKTGSA